MLAPRSFVVSYFLGNAEHNQTGLGEKKRVCSCKGRTAMLVPLLANASVGPVAVTVAPPAQKPCLLLL